MRHRIYCGRHLDYGIIIHHRTIRPESDLERFKINGGNVLVQESLKCLSQPFENFYETTDEYIEVVISIFLNIIIFCDGRD